MAGNNNSHFGESNNNNNLQRSRSSSGSSSSSSSRKGGGGGGGGGGRSSNKQPKLPQRGLGVAQLEKIRLHAELSGGGATTTTPPPLPMLHNPYALPNLSQEDMMRMQTIYESTTSSSFSYSAAPSSSSPLYGYHPPPNINVMGMSDIERANNTGFTNSKLLDPDRWSSPGNAFYDTQQQLHQQGMTRQLFDLQVEDSIKRRKEEWDISSGDEEVDLELRLSFKSS